MAQIRLNQLLELLPGGLADDEAVQLFHSARQARGGCVVKVGVCFNQAAVALVVGVAAQPESTRPKFYCVEPKNLSAPNTCVNHGGQAYEALRQTTRKLDCQLLADLICLPSDDELVTWGEPVSLLCIGPRDYDVMRASFEAWKPYLAREASIIFYGTSVDAPRRLMAELEKDGSLKRAGQVGNTFVCRSTTPPSQAKLTKDRKAASDFIKELASVAQLVPESIVDRLAHSSFVSSAHRYLYIETPKCACTAMKYFITELEKPNCELRRKPYLRETRLSMLIHQRDYIDLPTVLDLRPDAIRNLLSGKSDYFIFGLVRNPFSRLVSSFESKVRFLEPGFEKGPRWTAAETGADVRAVFADYVAKELKVIGRTEHHFSPQHVLLFPELLPYTKIFQVERFAEFEQSFLAHLKAQGAKVLPRFKNRNRTLYPDWRLYYDEATASHVQEYYRKDFDTFGYDLDSWRLKGEVQELRTSPEEAYWRKEIIDRNEMIEFLYELLVHRA